MFICSTAWGSAELIEFSRSAPLLPVIPKRSGEYAGSALRLKESTAWLGARSLASGCFDARNGCCGVVNYLLTRLSLSAL